MMEDDTVDVWDDLGDLDPVLIRNARKLLDRSRDQQQALVPSMVVPHEVRERQWNIPWRCCQVGGRAWQADRRFVAWMSELVTAAG